MGSSESWEDAAAKAGDVIRRVVSELTDAMAPWHAFDVLAWLQRANAAPAETYQESTHEGLSALVELAGLILMERSSAEPTAAPSGTDERIDAVEVAELCHRLDSGLRQILAAGQLLNLARHVSDDIGWELRYHLAEREMLLRNLGYPHMQERLLRGLFGAPDIVSALSATLGFTIDDALAVVAGLQQRIENAYWNGILAGHKHLRASHDHPKSVADATTRRRKANTAANRRAQSQNLADAAAIVSDRLGQRIAVTANELSSATGVENTAVEAVLKLMSRPIGGTAAAHLVERYLHGDNALRLQAVLHDPDHGYFPVSIGNLLFGLREMIEDALKTHPAFNSYAKHRGDWVERAASDALQEVIRPEQIYRNIEFVADDGKAVESDALLICDRVAIAVEAKAVALSPRARSGDRARVRRDMSRIVADTVHQADRLRHAITSDGHLRVRGQDQANIDLSDVRRVFPIAVTLEDVTSVTGSAAGFVDAGILPSRRGLPWIVNLQDLWVICEIVEGPAQLMHYLRQHEETVTLGLVTASEELDLFMTYLNQGLYFGDYLDADGNPTIGFFTLSMTDTLDAYYLHKTGQRKAVAEKPSQVWSPKAFRELVKHLEQHRPDGWATACLNMHEGDRGARNQIATMMRRLARRSRLDGLPHDEMRLFGQSQPGAFGVTGMSVTPRDDIEVLRTKLLTLCRARKYMARTSSWTGIGVVSNAPSKVAVLVQLDEPWAPDPAMDHLVEQMGLRPFDEVAASRT